MKTLVDLPVLLKEQYGLKHIVFKVKANGGVQNTTVDQYLKNSNTFASLLFAIGLLPHMRVVSCLNNSPEWHYLEMGIFKCGGIHVPISPILSTHQIEFVIKNVEPALVVVNSHSKQKQTEEIIRKLGLSARVLNLKQHNTLCTQSFVVPQVNINEEEAAVILYTSGSTETPKGVVLTHKNILTAVKEFSSVNIFDHCTNAISFLPLSHSGERKLNYSYLMRGISICFPDTIRPMLEEVLFFKPDIAAMVPFLIQQLTNEVAGGGYNLNGLKVVCGGAPLNKYLIENFEQLGGKVFEVYGLTETASLLAYNKIGAERTGTVGQLAKNISVLFSSEKEILVKGDSVMKGYWINKYEIDSGRNNEGWFATGDLGEMRDGFLNLIGRAKSSFKNSKGVFIYPELLEKQLLEILHSDFVIAFKNETAYLSAIIKPKNKQAEEISSLLAEYNKTADEDLKINRYTFASEISLKENLKLNRNKIIEDYKPHSFVDLF